VPKRILVVDDQESMRHMLADLLETMGHESLTVPTGLEALEQLGDDVDLVITDLNMPEMDGLELMKRIKARNPSLPVIVISGYGTFNTERQILSVGADGYIPKPCTIHRVRETVNSALGLEP
jgi:CheY-like chemotaxis protein